jgi:hypothetical protein
MKANANSSLTIKKIVYYLDEILILLIVLISVISADAIHKAIKGKSVGWHDFLISWPNLIVSALVSIFVYGSLYSRPYSEKEKAPMYRRAAAAVTQGFTWKLMFND